MYLRFRKPNKAHDAFSARNLASITLRLVEAGTVLRGLVGDLGVLGGHGTNARLDKDCLVEGAASHNPAS